jgi:hypothetical protein
VGVGMNVAQGGFGQSISGSKGDATVKEIASSFAQLIGIIMLTITLAVSLAAVSQMLG